MTARILFSMTVLLHGANEDVLQPRDESCEAFEPAVGAEQILRRLDRTVEKPVGPNRAAPDGPAAISATDRREDLR